MRPFETCFGRETVREVLIVRVAPTRATAGASAWPAATRSTRPSTSTARHPSSNAISAPALLDRYGRHAAPRRAAPDAAGAAPARTGLARGDRCRSRQPSRPTLAFVAGHRMAKGALEAAVLDAELRAQGRSMGEAFGAEREWVDCGVSVGIAPTLEELLDEVIGYLEEGYRRIKLKIRPGWDLVPVGAVREELGPRGMLQVDANTAYTADDIPLLAELDEFDLLLIEQPFAEEDLATHARLAAECDTPGVPRRVDPRRLTAIDAIDRGATRSSTSSRAAWAAISRRCACTTPAASSTCRSGAAACSRPGSAAPRTSRSPRCRASCCPATRRRRRATSPRTSPSRSCSARRAPRAVPGSRCPGHGRHRARGAGARLGVGTAPVALTR